MPGTVKPKRRMTPAEIVAFLKCQITLLQECFPEGFDFSLHAFGPNAKGRGRNLWSISTCSKPTELHLLRNYVDRMDPTQDPTP